MLVVAMKFTLFSYVLAFVVDVIFASEADVGVVHASKDVFVHFFSSPGYSID